MGFVGKVLHDWNQFEDVEKRVVIGFDRVRRISTEFTQPAETHHCLQRHVLVVVDEVALNQITEFRELSPQLFLQQQ